MPRGKGLIELEIPQTILRILEARGIEAADLDLFLNPSIGNLSKPTELPGIELAADLILRAFADHKRIVVFGDYDCDGVCATAIMVKALRSLGADVAPFLPDRLSEGYGMSDASVSRMLAENPNVEMVITVDNGINSVKQVLALKKRGIFVVVTDHHLPGDDRPAADVTVNPKCSAPPELDGICGAGVAFLLANQLVAEARRRGLYDGANIGGPLLILAGIATVTDLMPLLGQNRILVAEALKRFLSWSPIGIRELHNRASKSGYDRLSSRDFGFAIGPRLNAAGRVASGMKALELILDDDRERVRDLARIIDGYNVERKSLEQRMTDEAMSKIVPNASVQVIDLPDGHSGVAGIVASRVMERVGTPVCVVVDGHGSARAPKGINIRDAFVACADCLENFGGHAAAGGFVLKSGCIDRFRLRLNEYCQSAVAEENEADSGPEIWVRPAELTLEFAEWLQRLEPFGEGNPEPVFGIKDVTMLEVKPLGIDGKHLQIAFGQRSCPRALWWNHGDMVEELRGKSANLCDIIFTLVISDYGERHVELRIKNIKIKEM